jgi:hypothetical protein
MYDDREIIKLWTPILFVRSAVLSALGTVQTLLVIIWLYTPMGILIAIAAAIGLLLTVESSYIIGAASQEEWTRLNLPSLCQMTAM